MKLSFSIEVNKGGAVHEAPTIVGYGEGHIYIALPPHMERLFTCFEPLPPCHNGLTLPLHQGIPSTFGIKVEYQNYRWNGLCLC